MVHKVDLYHNKDAAVIIQPENGGIKVDVSVFGGEMYQDDDYPKGRLYVVHSNGIHISGMGKTLGTAKANLRKKIRRRLEFGYERLGQGFLDNELHVSKDWQHETVRSYSAARAQVDRMFKERAN